MLEGFTYDKNPKASSQYYLLSLLCLSLRGSASCRNKNYYFTHFSFLKKTLGGAALPRLALHIVHLDDLGVDLNRMGTD
jgi:hypothetical protein